MVKSIWLATKQGFTGKRGHPELLPFENSIYVVDMRIQFFDEIESKEIALSIYLGD